MISFSLTTGSPTHCLVNEVIVVATTSRVDETITFPFFQVEVVPRNNSGAVSWFLLLLALLALPLTDDCNNCSSTAVCELQFTQISISDAVTATHGIVDFKADSMANVICN